jgi:hypothetical protein
MKPEVAIAIRVEWIAERNRSGSIRIKRNNATSRLIAYCYGSASDDIAASVNRRALKSCKVSDKPRPNIITDKATGKNTFVKLLAAGAVCV